MKDFHDLYSMISPCQLLPFHNLETVVRSVFEHRQTPLDLPITYTEDEIAQVQKFWSEYLKNLRAEHSDLPQMLAQVLTQINDWLQCNTRLIDNEHRIDPILNQTESPHTVP